MSFDTNKITLQYLANNIYNKLDNIDNKDKIINQEDILFYKKRLIKVFKLQLKNYKLNNEIDNIFNNYVNELIYTFKLEDKNEEIQKDLKNKDININEERKSTDLSCNYNKLIYKNNKKPNIENFVINNKEEKIIYPKIKNINIKTEYYKKRYNKNIK